MVRWWPFLIAGAVIVFDRMTKWIVERQFQPWDTVVVIPGLFQIVHTRNTGIAFGMFAEQGNGRWGNYALVGFTVVVTAFIAWTLARTSKRGEREHWALRLALALVMGGAAGNLYDRVRFGSVTDFLDFFWGRYHFPVFNLADSAITFGAGLLLVNLWWFRHLEEARRSSLPKGGR